MGLYTVRILFCLALLTWYGDKNSYVRSDDSMEGTPGKNDPLNPDDVKSGDSETQLDFFGNPMKRLDDRETDSDDPVDPYDTKHGDLETRMKLKLKNAMKSRDDRDSGSDDQLDPYDTEHGDLETRMKEKLKNVMKSREDRDTGAAEPTGSQIQTRRSPPLPGYNTNEGDVFVRTSEPEKTGGLDEGGVDQDDERRILQVHNKLRTTAGLPSLSWNLDLRDIAQDWANKCTPRLNPDYNGRDDTFQLKGLGYRSWAATLKKWMANLSIIRTMSPNITSMGCGYASCDHHRQRFYFCNYFR